MPWGSVTLRPGIDVEMTPTLNVAGYSSSRLIRFKAGLAQKIGGWENIYPNAVGGVPRTMHAWQDLNESRNLAVGTTTTLGIISDGSLTDITPQTYTSNFTPDFVTVASSAVVTVNDPNFSTTTYNAVEFKTPIAIGGIVLSGVYPIDLVLGAYSYEITAASAATTSRSNSVITGATQANPCVVTTVGAHGLSNGDLIYIDEVVGMTQINNRIYAIAGVTANTFQLSGVNSTAYTAYSSGGKACPSAVPFFTTTSGSPAVTVTLQDHGLAAGDTIAFALTTTLQSSVVTITIAAPGVVTWFTGTHGLVGGEIVTFTTTGALPTGITAGTSYYVLAAPRSS